MKKVIYLDNETRVLLNVKGKLNSKLVNKIIEQYIANENEKDIIRTLNLEKYKNIEDALGDDAILKFSEFKLEKDKLEKLFKKTYKNGKFKRTIYTNFKRTNKELSGILNC